MNEDNFFPERPGEEPTVPRPPQVPQCPPQQAPQYQPAQAFQNQSAQAYQNQSTQAPQTPPVQAYQYLPNRSAYPAPPPYHPPVYGGQQRPPYYPAPYPAPKPKKKRMSLRLAVVALCCALLGSLLGGATVGLVMYRAQNQSNSSTPPVSEPAVPSAEATTRPTTPPSEGAMTPAQVYQENVGAVVGVYNETATGGLFGQSTEVSSTGTGFLISSDGEILTNYHVIQGASRVTVALYSGATYEAQVLGYEAESDIALLKIDASGLPTVSLGDSDSLYVGAEVAAIGNPLGELTYSLNVGYISAMERYVTTDGSPIDMMQIDASINPGNSGGPLFDMGGSVVGITTAKYSGTTATGTSIEGIGFAIPINDVVKILDDLRENGRVPNRAFIGITASTVSRAHPGSGLPDGAYVESVTENSSGALAGLRTGDVITAIDGVSITGIEDLSGKLKNYRASDTATLTVYRSGRTLELTISFDAKPDSLSETQPTEASDAPTEAPGSSEPAESTEDGFSFPWEEWFP